MSKSSRRASASTPSRGSASDATTPEPQQPVDGMRETVEAVLMAFLLAFLFRSFVAEAFVIPTGSMAPTLYGRHKEVTCPQCNFFYAVGASQETSNGSEVYLPNYRVTDSVCPNCRFMFDIEEDPVFKGDRILVNKFTFNLSEPERFDVIVFKYPENPSTNYIKRLIGLPGEWIRIQQGDVYARKSDTAPWQILRKRDPVKQRALQIPVYDDTKAPAALLAAGWPERFSPMVEKATEEAMGGWTDDQTGWTQDAEKRSWTVDATGGADIPWLRYRHLVPDQSAWDALEAKRTLPTAKPQIVLDFCAYNAFRSRDNRNTPELGRFWVGDLSLWTVLDVESLGDGDDPAELTLELVEGRRTYQCRIDLRTGAAQLVYLDGTLPFDDADEQVIGEAETSITGTGSFRLCFSNIDERLCLWHDDELIVFRPTGDAAKMLENTKPGTGPTLDSDSKWISGVYPAPAINGPTQHDLTPAAVHLTNAKATFSRMAVKRDIYYRASFQSNNLATKYDAGGERKEVNGGANLDDLVHDPESWFAEYQDKAMEGGIVFEQLGDDELIVLGDNSPRSKDSRLWTNERRDTNRAAIKRGSLVGKAFFIYWPHGVPFLNGGEGFPVTYHADDQNPRSYPKLRFPFYPYLSRMTRIR